MGTSQRRTFLPLLGTLLLASTAFGTTVIERTLAQKASRADRVVLAQVLDTRTVVPDEGNPRRMLTVTRVVVGAEYKGTGAHELEIVQLGGRKGLWEAHVPGDATFTVGETALLLVTCRDPRAPARCTLLTLGEGKLEVKGAEVLQRSIARGTVTRRPFAEVVDELLGALGARPRSIGKVTR